MVMLWESSISVRGVTSQTISSRKDGIDATTKRAADGELWPSIFLSQIVGNGQRHSTITIRVGAEDFKGLARVMFEADRQAAIKAFAQILDETA